MLVLLVFLPFSWNLWHVARLPHVMLNYRLPQLCSSDLSWSEFPCTSIGNILALATPKRGLYVPQSYNICSQDEWAEGKKQTIKAAELSEQTMPTMIPTWAGCRGVKEILAFFCKRHEWQLWGAKGGIIGAGSQTVAPRQPSVQCNCNSSTHTPATPLESNSQYKLGTNSYTSGM